MSRTRDILNRLEDRDARGWRRGAIRVAAIVSAVVLALFGFLVYVLLASGKADYWAGDIAAFERADISNPPAKDAIVFAGGGMFRHWDEMREDLAQALAPLPVINRGFGGAHVAHVTAFAPRIILPYEPAAVVISAGGDDLADVGGKPPDQVEADMAELVAVLRHEVTGAQSEPQVYILSITPAPMRAARWPVFRQANAQLRALAQATPGVHFIDLTPLLMSSDDRINNDLYRWDGLTFNEAGYDAIGRLIRQRLLVDLGDRFRAAPPTVTDPFAQPAPAP